MTMMADDKTLIARILGGETEAFRHLMRRHGGTLLAFIEGVVGNREEAEDVVQEAFVIAYRSLHQYNDGKASFATWLHRIAYHEALRRKKRRRLPTLSWDEDERLLKYAEETDADNWLREAQKNNWKGSTRRSTCCQNTTRCSCGSTTKTICL